jgi:hypothetical protein
MAFPPAGKRVLQSKQAALPSIAAMVFASFSTCARWSRAIAESQNLAAAKQSLADRKEVVSTRVLPALRSDNGPGRSAVLGSGCCVNLQDVLKQGLIGSDYQGSAF